MNQLVVWPLLACGTEQPEGDGAVKEQLRSGWCDKYEQGWKMSVKEEVFHVVFDNTRGTVAACARWIANR